jgi:predicted N-acetyltransferase YhbS
VAEYEDQIIGFAVQQILPMAGPLFVLPDWRGTGLAEMLARDLKDRMAANYIAVASSEFSEKLCRELGMHEVPGKLFRK